MFSQIFLLELCGITYATITTEHDWYYDPQGWLNPLRWQILGRDLFQCYSTQVMLTKADNSFFTCRYIYSSVKCVVIRTDSLKNADILLYILDLVYLLSLFTV